MACDVDAIIEDSTCVECFIPTGLQPAVLLALLCAIRDGDTDMSCDPQALIDEATCLQCKIPDGMMFPALISVACAIAQGGTGGGCENLVGVVSPVGVVTPDCVGQFYTDTVGDVLWQAIGATSADWKQWI